MTGDGIARVRGGGGATCKRRHLYEGKPRWPRCTFNYAHHPEKLSGHEQLSTLSTLASEKCRYSGRKMYPGRKIWSLICPIPAASVQALEQVKEVGEFFSSMPPLQNSVTSFSFKSSYTFFDMWMWDCERDGWLSPHLSNLGCEQSSLSIRPPIIRLLSSPRPRGIHWYPGAIPRTMADCTPILCSTAPPTRPLWGRVGENFRGEGRAGCRCWGISFEQSIAQFFGYICFGPGIQELPQ